MRGQIKLGSEKFLFGGHQTLERSFLSQLECTGDDHGTKGWFELEEMLKTIPFQPRAMCRDTLIHPGCLISAGKDSRLIIIQPSHLKVEYNKSITGAVG